ncbi:hypothetical protein [Aeromicrobium sp. JJY06]|uniref:hypothetical protein n=1 Tax=Aeromicrobium sp. JJY06 TaxID=3373478 RepID=UPI00376EBC28
MAGGSKGRRVTVRHSPTPNPPAKAEKFSEREFLHPKILAREAAKVAQANGLTLHPAEIRRLVSKYTQHRDPVSEQIELFRSWVLTYADPTGDAAVDNVLAEGRKTA